jgi:hypothetical protein
MNQFNTKITYLKEGKIDYKRTSKAFAKFYAAKYGRIALINVKRVYNAEISNRLYQEAK